MARASVAAGRRCIRATALIVQGLTMIATG
jgi:hypothetical protein